MANEITAARTKIKKKLDIESSDTSQDDLLLDCIEQAIPRLAPWVQYPVPADESLSLASGEDSFTMPAGQLDKLYTRTSVSGVWNKLDFWNQHGNKVYINEGIGTSTSLKIFAKRPYTFTDADVALLALNHPSAMLPLYLFAMSEFAVALVGNKRKWNDYIQTNSARTLDEMRELVSYYEDRAIAILENEISAEGQ